MRAGKAAAFSVAMLGFGAFLTAMHEEPRWWAGFLLIGASVNLFIALFVDDERGDN